MGGEGTRVPSRSPHVLARGGGDIWLAYAGRGKQSASFLAVTPGRCKRFAQCCLEAQGELVEVRYRSVKRTTGATRAVGTIGTGSMGRQAKPMEEN